MKNGNNISVIRVSDIETLIKTICNIKEPFTKEDFKKNLLINKQSISDSTINDYFDFLNKYKLIMRKFNQYESTEIIKYLICPKYNERNFDKEVKDQIYNILYSKEHLFRKLMEILTNRIKKENITFVNEHTLNTLLDWGIELEAIEKTNDGYYYKIKYNKTNNITNNEFWTYLKRAYDLLTEKDRYLIGDVFVKIPKLRNLTSSLMGIRSEQFDILLTKILRDNQYLLNIEFSGATIIYSSEDIKKVDARVRQYEKPFIKNDNRYYFIALKNNNLGK